jgi:serine/threonine protein kinase
MRLQEGQRFAGYTVERRLGAGGMASVFLAQEEGLGRKVALKVMPEHLAEQPFFVERFQQEAAVIARLEHPNIVPVYRFGVESFGEVQVPWMSLRFIEGGELTQQLKKESDREAVLGFLSQLAAALDYAHGQGIVHRDLKPQNVLVTAAGQVYLADFGIAKILEGARIAGPTGDTIFGTPEYMAPEQARGLPVTSKVDVYALGVLVYEWLTGGVPFRADTPQATLLKHIQEPLPAKALDHLPLAVAASVRRALSKEPGDRFSSAGAFVQAVRDGFAGQPMARPPMSQARKVWFGAATTALLVASGVSLYSLQREPRSEGKNAPPAAVDSPGSASLPDPDQRPAFTALPSAASSTPIAPAVAFAESLAEQAGLPPPDMAVTAMVAPEREVYRQGETVEIGFVLDEPGFPAVFVHSQDGSTTLLYPNDYEKATRVPGKKLHWVGAAGQPFRIEVSPPFGTDVVQVVAFRRMEELKLLLDALALGKSAQMYAVDRPKLSKAITTVATRGMKVVSSTTAEVGAQTIQPGWGEDQAVLRTAASNEAP